MWASRARGTETHSWSCGVRSSQGVARQGSRSNFSIVPKCLGLPVPPFSPVQIPGSAQSPGMGWHCPLALLVWLPPSVPTGRLGCSPPARGADSREGFSARPTPALGVPQVESGRGLSTGTLLHAQHDSCPSRWRTDLCCSRHLAFPFVELAKRDSCQAWDSPCPLSQNTRIF